MFLRCKKLKHITLSDDLETIKEWCFQESGLIELTVPTSVKKIEKYALSMCPDLKKIVLPERLETIPEGCFWQSGIEEIEVPESVKVIE